MGGSRRLISNFFMDVYYVYIKLCIQWTVTKTKDLKEARVATYEASPVRTGNLAHSIQTQLPDHVYRLSSRNVKPL